ncbi:MAG TPA: hypothetical protein VGC70_09935 [Burkholderiales bacterium]
MKGIAKAFVVAALVTAATAASATSTAFPSSAQEQTPLASEFAGIVTYKQQHHDSIAKQAPMAMPSGRSDNYNATSEFPNIVTYKKLHRNDPVQVSSTPTFPYSVPASQSMADEGLVPGITGVAPADGPLFAVGATR